MTDQNELSNVSADGEPASKDIQIKIRKTIQHELCREVRLCGAMAASCRHYRADELDKFETHDLETLAYEERLDKYLSVHFERANR